MGKVEKNMFCHRYLHEPNIIYSTLTLGLI
jgi:hypothetical protein